MKRTTYWIVSIAVILVVATVVVLIVGRPFSKREEPVAIIESPDAFEYEWKDNLGCSDPLMPINFSDPQIVNGISDFYKNKDSDFVIAWSNDDYKVDKKITNKPEDIAKSFSTVKSRKIFYIKPEDKDIEAKIGDLVVLSTLSNKIDIPPDYETVDDGINNYKMKILIAVNDGKQNLEFMSITEDGRKMASSVIVDVNKNIIVVP